MLRASLNEMRKVYRDHRARCGQCDSHSLRLVLSYAVECGVKILLMEYYKVSEYGNLPITAQIGHDVREGLKQLRGPTISVTRTRHGRGPQENVHPRHLHEAFRYGIPLEKAPEITGELRNTLAWLDQRIV